MNNFLYIRYLTLTILIFPFSVLIIQKAYSQDNIELPDTIELDAELLEEIPIPYRYIAEEGFEIYRIGEDFEPEFYDGLLINDILWYSDDFSTNKSFILAVLQLRHDQVFDLEQFLENYQRLINYGILYSLEYNFDLTPNGKVNIILSVEDKWTLLPIFKYNQLGDETELILGAYDMNFLGQAMEVGGTYIRRQGLNLFSFWYYNPRLFSRDIFFSGVLFSKGLVDTYYTLPFVNDISDSQDLEIDVINGVTQELDRVRLGAYLELGKDFDYDISVILRVIEYRETISYLQNPETLEIEYFISMASLNLLYGKIDFLENYKFNGYKLQMMISSATRYIGSERDIIRIFVSYTHFFNFLSFMNTGFRVALGRSLCSDPYQVLSIGDRILEGEVHIEKDFFNGLSTVRGLVPTMIHGQNICFFNIENRFKVDEGRFFWWDTLSYVLQLFVYVDGGACWDNPQISSNFFDNFVVVTGAGAIVTFTRIANFYIIADGYYRFKQAPEAYFNFSTSHFFY